MWIMTQDRNEMINTDTIESISVDRNTIGVGRDKNRSRLMGVYQSKEDANEVLMDIMGSQQAQCKTYYMPEFERR